MMWGPYGHYGGWGWGGTLVGGILMLLFWVAFIALTVWVIRLLLKPGQPRQEGTSPLDIAKARYARGEITREQFEQLKRDLV